MEITSYLTPEIAQLFANNFIYFWCSLLVVLYPLYLVRKLIFT